MNIGLFGGTFNPIHKGHLKIAKLASKKFNLNKVFFIITKIPPHKSLDYIIDTNHRLNMLKLAIKNVKNFKISQYELQRKVISYSYYTVKYFKKLYPKANLFFIIGMDEFKILPTWYKINDILKMTEFIVVSRIAENPPIHYHINSKVEYEKHIHFLKIKPIRISSTYIRKNLWRKSFVWNYLPNRVEQYIKKHLLYL